MMVLWGGEGVAFRIVAINAVRGCNYCIFNVHPIFIGLSLSLITGIIDCALWGEGLYYLHYA